MNRPRVFADWRFLAMLAFLLMVGYLVLTGVVAIQQNAEKGRQIDALVASARQDAKDAAAERRDLLASQRALLSRIDSYDARQRALLAWLRKNGIDIPTRFVEVPATPSGTPSGGRSGPPAPGKPTPTPPQVNPPQVNPPAVPDQPGNSDGHPGKGKGPKVTAQSANHGRSGERGRP